MAGGPKAKNQELAAVALAAGKTVAAAAGAAGVAERTVYAWNESPQFRALVAGFRTAMIGRACGELADAMGEAARVLRGLLASASDSIRLRAACAVLESGLKVVELADLAKRVEELERAQQGRTE